MKYFLICTLSIVAYTQPEINNVFNNLNDHIETNFTSGQINTANLFVDNTLVEEVLIASSSPEQYITDNLMNSCPEHNPYDTDMNNHYQDIQDICRERVNNYNEEHKSEDEL